MNRKIIIAITGASGSVYAKLLINRIKDLIGGNDKVVLIFSNNAKAVWEYELGKTDFNSFPFEIIDNKDFFSGPASGSAGYDTMIICPASMGTAGRIANGISNDLITRAADVVLKEKRNLILVPRETPFNLIHLRNLTTLAEAGATIIPASPSFYSKPESIDDAVNTVVDKVLTLSGFNNDGFVWGE
jgi:4-hydroxy-3-polyprenylbenzoate decarboxylase